MSRNRLRAVAGVLAGSRLMTAGHEEERMRLFGPAARATGKVAKTAASTAFPGGVWGAHARKEQTTGRKVARSVGLFTPVDGTPPPRGRGVFSIW